MYIYIHTLYAYDIDCIVAPHRQGWLLDGKDLGTVLVGQGPCLGGGFNLYRSLIVESSAQMTKEFTDLLRGK